MAKIYTAQEAADALGIARRTVHKYGQMFGWQKWSGAYPITDEMIEQIRQYMFTHPPGRRRKEK